MHGIIPDTYHAREHSTSLDISSRDLQSVESWEGELNGAGLERLRDNRRPHRLQIFTSALPDATNEELAKVL